MSGTFPPPLPIGVQLRELHAELRSELPGVDRIAIAIYDPKTDFLRTFASSDDGDVLRNHQVKLAGVPSLKALADARRDRIIDDLSVLRDSPAVHSRALASRFGSSYTRPLIDGDRLRGFVFFDASVRSFFTQPIVGRLTIYAELIAVMVTRSMMPAHILASAVAVAAELSHSRDPETGAHLDRMSRYALAIAQRLSAERNLSDESLQHLLALAPLHDVGKIAIPDRILLKPGRLEAAEMAIMQTHTTCGALIVDRLVERLGLAMLEQSTMLRNIVLHHHERWDGAGYPHGLSGEAIPLEARIVAVADVFDALTSARPYKAAWSVDEARRHLHEHAGAHFDPRVVAAFDRAIDDIDLIRTTFVDRPEVVRFHEGYDGEL